MAGKKFKFRIDSANQVAIKEDVTKVSNKNGSKIKVTLCLDENLNVAPIAIFKDNILTKLQLDDIGSKERYVIYYPFEEVTYIATVVIELKEGKRIRDKDIVIYIPKGIVSTEELYCDRVTSSFSRGKKQEILNKVINFATTRI